MKIKLFIVVFILFVSFVVAYEYEEKIEKTFELNKDGIFKLSNINGIIEVSTHKKNVAYIKAIKSVDRKSDFDEIEVKFDADEDRLKVHVRNKKKWGRIKFKVDFYVKLPENLASATMKSVNGKVESRGSFGDIISKTVNGKIEFEGDFTEGSFKSVNGNVYVYLEDALKGDVSLRTVNGTLNLELDRKSSFDVEGSTVNGSIRSDFDLYIKRGFVGSRVKGSVNDGKYKVYLSSVNGSIKLQKI